jgi:hypothetical protein
MQTENRPWDQRERAIFAFPESAVGTPENVRDSTQVRGVAHLANPSAVGSSGTCDEPRSGRPVTHPLAIDREVVVIPTPCWFLSKFSDLGE